MGSNELAAIIAATEAVLFDFDGPICDVFAGKPAPSIARDLADLLAQHDEALGGKAVGMDDPWEILRLAAQGDEAALRDIEDSLRSAESAAVLVAGAPIAGAVESLRLAYASGRKVAVVSNNSADCVAEFLDRNDLSDCVHEIVGRAAYQPELLKPSPYSLLLAAERLATAAEHCTLIGDSVTDVQAARAAGALSIGFANKEHKTSLLSDAGADVVVTSMTSVASQLAAPTTTRRGD